MKDHQLAKSGVRAPRLLPLVVCVALATACGSSTAQDVADDGSQPPATTTMSATTSGSDIDSSAEPTFDASEAASIIVQQLKSRGDAYQFTYTPSDAPVLRGQSVIDGVTLEDAMDLAKEVPLRPSDQVIQGTLYMPYYGEEISKDPLVVDPVFDHDEVWVIRRFHFESGSSHKIGFEPDEPETTRFVDIVEFLRPDGTWVAAEVPELDSQ
jgi:hypothetical protein